VGGVEKLFTSLRRRAGAAGCGTVNLEKFRGRCGVGLKAAAAGKKHQEK
jgi:hypothetical protein